MTTFGDAKEAVQTIEEIREQLERVLEFLRPLANQSDEPDAGRRILAEVLEQGGSVTRDELYRIAAAHGMDRRGLGGFFRQSGKTRLYELPGGRVLLTPYGVEQAQRYTEKAPVGYERPEPDLPKIAEASLAEDWDSDEDSAYDSA